MEAPTPAESVAAEGTHCLRQVAAEVVLKGDNLDWSRLDGRHRVTASRCGQGQARHDVETLAWRVEGARTMGPALYFPETNP